MKIRYIGESFGATYLTPNKIYEASDEGDMYRVIDDDAENDFNYDNDPEWKKGYLYSKENPAIYGGKQGRWEIIES